MTAGSPVPPTNGTASDRCLDKEKEFFVKDIPLTFDDWAVFRVFQKFGLVHNVRIPLNQATGVSKFGFVTMINLNGADAVRKQLVKRRLVVNDSVSFLVNDVRERAPQPESKPVAKKLDGRVLASIQNNGGSAPNGKTWLKELHTTKPKYLFHDIPLKQDIKCKVVTSPFPPTLEEGFTFHVVREETPLPQEYTSLQCAMNEYCSVTPSIGVKNIDTKVGDCVVFGSANVAYRGQRIATDAIYLMDTGEIVPYSPSQLWPMVPRFTLLPNLVATCSLARVQWRKPTVQKFSAIREVVHKWCIEEKLLTVRNEGYKGVCNLVQLIGKGGSTLTNSLAKKGYCDVSPVTPPMNYSREEILAPRAKCCNPPDSLKTDQDFKEILIAAENMSLA